MALIKSFQGNHPYISPTAFVAEDVVIIGNVKIYDGASIWYGCVLRGDVNYIEIGSGTNIQDNCTIHVSRYNGPTVIGEGVTVGHNVVLHACQLSDHCFVGMGSILLDGSKIAKHGMLGAGAFLSPNKSINEGELWLGLPAKFNRMLKEEEIEYIYTSKKNYIELSNQYKIST